MKRIFAALLAAQERGEDCAWVTILASSGSVPRGAGAHMLVGAAGRIAGTIGGGAVEGRCIALAQQVIATGETRVQDFSLTSTDVQDLGMICGGAVKVCMRRVSAENAQAAQAAQKALERIASGEKTWLVENMQTGGISLCGEDAAFGAPVPPEVRAQLGRVPALFQAQGAWYYGEMIVSPGRVWVFGGGHVAQALVPLLAGLDFRCVVVEDRAEFAEPSLFPGAQVVRLLQIQEWEASISIAQEDCVCVMTRGHQNDLACQAFALKSPAGYIGVIGSRRKIAATSEKLRALGYSDADIARIITPIGLDIGAQTPAEIAVSIAAQLIAHRAKRG